MTTSIELAVAAIKTKMDGQSLDGTAKFVVEDEGSIVIDGGDVRAGDEETDVTLTADADTFKAILDGDLNPTTAFMSGKLSVDGDMGMAMKLGSVLS